MIVLGLLALACPTLQESLREVLAVEPLGRRERSAIYTDTLAARLARGEWSAPREGETIRAADGEERTWTRYEAGEGGWFGGRAFRGGWAFGVLEVPEPGPWRLQVVGPSAVLVDGVPRCGDVYQLGITRIPLAREAGPMSLLFRTGRGRMRAVLERAPAPVYLEELDTTLPDVVREEVSAERLLRMAVIVANARREPALGYRFRTSNPSGPPSFGFVPSLGPESYRKVGISVAVFSVPEGDSLPVQVELLDPAGEPVHSLSLELAIRGSHERHARTFTSKIDRSVQYYAVTPPAEPSDEQPALVLSLHGAGVEARGQAAAYEPKPDMVIVAPTGRRPFGFDWEDWGRLDALEVLELASKHYGTDARRTYLTGHSMGGHGAWQLGVHLPARFAAIAPSAGWRDFWSYGGAPDFPAGDPVAALLARSTNASRTTWLERNLVHAGVYVLHGDADSNVPVSEARAMRQRLAGFHPNFAYYERAGAGHWWGNECVDWPPLFDFLARNRLPQTRDVLEVELATINPAITSRCHWVLVLGQALWNEPSRVRARLVPDERLIELELENVTRLALDLRSFSEPTGEDAPRLAPGDPLRLREGEHEREVEWPEHGVLTLERDGDGRLAPAQPRDARLKGHHRAGPFKQAFQSEMVFVYGTGGTPQEQAWSLAKARYDHETWRYRANGAVDVASDVDFLTWPLRERSVILYGNQDTNRAFSAVLDEAADFELRQGRVRVGELVVEGDDLALLCAYPRKDCERAMVAVVGGTGLAGSRLTDHLPYFVSGVGYPDWTVLGVEMLEQGLAGVRAAGFFDDDWSSGAGASQASR